MTDFKFNIKRSTLSLSEWKTSLERRLFNTGLHDKGLSANKYLPLSVGGASPLMTETCIYASLKLAEIEARAGLSKKISAQPF